MIATTPAQERETRFSCPNPPCARFHRPGEGHIVPRSWTGTRQHIERRRCTVCDREFSEREGTLMARSKLPEDMVIRLVQCQRWGVCEAGPADMCAVALTTVPRLQRVAAHRAATPQRQVVCAVDVLGVQWEEAHATLRPHQVAWLPTAWALGRWLLLWGDGGPRTQEQGAALVAQGVARGRALPIFCTEGWQASRAALLQVVGMLYRRRRRGKVGRKPHPRLVAPQQLFDAQGVKGRHPAGQVVEGSRRVGFGGPRRFGPPWRVRQRGTPIQTAFMERWYGPLRGLVAPRRRRPRWLSWRHARHRGRLWLMVSLSHCVMPPKSRQQGHTPRTPAMAVGLPDHGWSSGESIWLPGHTAPVLRQQLAARITHLLPPGTASTSRRQHPGAASTGRGARGQVRCRSEGCLRCSLLFSRTTLVFVISSTLRLCHNMSSAVVRERTLRQADA